MACTSAGEVVGWDAATMEEVVRVDLAACGATAPGPTTSEELVQVGCLP